MIRIACIKNASELPGAWDNLADNYFQRKKFLLHAEKYNPCQQRYYMQWNNDRLVSAAIVYTLRLDLLTFIRVKSPVTMHIAGIPCSVSSPGIFGHTDSVNSLKEHICKTEKGLILFLNLTTKPGQSDMAGGNTLPSIVISKIQGDWHSYYASLRSSYRRRLRMLSPDDKQLEFKKIPACRFSEAMYGQYLQVFRKSSDKLEKLTPEFFQNLPEEFEITACIIDNIVIGWNIQLTDNDTCYFFLGGIDYVSNRRHNTYLRLLAMLVRQGIEGGVSRIDLGQTAEIPKMRMGGIPEQRFMQAFHTNRLLNYLLRRFSNLLEYKMPREQSHPFKKLHV